MPRLAGFQAQHPDIDIRISANDQLAPMDDPELDLVLRYGFDEVVPSSMQASAETLFGERLTPVVSPWLLAQAQAGQVPPLAQVADLAGHALLEEDDHRPSAQYLSWRRWLQHMGQPDLAPRRWIYLNYTHQQVQGALAGQGVALARMALVHEHLARGELVEPFGPAGRLASPASYWLLPLPGARLTPELQAFLAWVRQEASRTRLAITDAPDA
jgi:LysR family glycine cleavage system transcriptional activator